VKNYDPKLIHCVFAGHFLDGFADGTFVSFSKAAPPFSTRVGVGGDVAFDEDDGNNRRKISPIADWTWGQVWAYVEKYDVPYNPLHDQFMPSIGCEPCTRAIAVGEPFRAGRWWWESEAAKECGLHVADHANDNNTRSGIPA
jgi:3'-phosphoadenosine 5'-phosphosulfate sulfotransferase (PAPS reductase)/FAD synthetase